MQFPFEGDPSLHLLGSLPKLESVDISIAHFTWAVDEEELLDNLYGPASRGDLRHIRNHYRDDLKQRYERDATLKTIPLSTLSSLRQLRIRYRQDLDATLQPTNWDSFAPAILPFWKSTDVLDYVLDLHTTEWDMLPFPYLATNAEESLANACWREARAAVHFDEGLVPPSVKAGEEGMQQWCTWSLEWAMEVYTRGRMEELMGLNVMPKTRPRPFGQLFERTRWAVGREGWSARPGVDEKG